MGDKYMKSTSNLAVAIAAGLFFAAAPMSVASAADLGGDCCADLEERVAELEATTVRKGNRKVSLKLFGFVHRAMMVWSADENTGVSDNDIYSVGGGSTSGSRFGMKGSANIGGGWSAGFLLEYGVGDTLAGRTSQNVDDTVSDGGNPVLRHDVLYLKSKQIGTFYMGHSSESTDGIAEIDLSGSKVATKFSQNTWNGGFRVDNTVRWGDVANNVDGTRGDAMIRYDTPTFAGFTASGTYAEDDVWSAALRYANEFGGVLRVAAGIGYLKAGDEETGVLNGEVTQLSGSVSAMHVPTGLNIAFSAGKRSTNAILDAALVAGGAVNNGLRGGYDDDTYWHLKAGIKQKWTSLGATSLYGEYAAYDVNNTGVRQNLTGATRANSYVGTQATMWGLGVVQKIDAAAMEIYAAYRVYDTTNDVSAFGTAQEAQWSGAMLGARIKF